MNPQSTAQRFYRSTGAAAFSQFWRVGVALGVDISLRRQIPEADYGLYQWAFTAFLILGAIRDLGLVYNVVRDDERPFGNLLRLELLWGAILVVGVWFAAPWLAEGFRDPRPDVVPVLRAMTLFLFLEGLSQVPKVWLESELDVRRAVVPEILRNLTMAIVALTAARLGYGVWSLVLGQVAAAAVYAVLLWHRVWGEIPLISARTGTLALIARSWPLALIWFLVILIDRIDIIVVGRFDHADTLGEYEFAYSRAFLVCTILTPTITRTLYPALVAFRQHPKQLFEAYRLATVLLVSIQAPIAWFLFVNPTTTLRILGGTQWETSPAFLKVLCFAPLIEPIGRLGGEVLKTLHRDRLWIFSNLLTLAAFGIGGSWATLRFGPMGMAWANYLPIGGFVIAAFLYRLSPTGFRRLASDIAVIYLVPTLVFLLVAQLVDDAWTRFAISLVALVAVLAFSWLRHGPQFRAFLQDPVAATEGEAARRQ